VLVEVELEQRWRLGGVVDGFIEGFHDLFGLMENIIEFGNSPDFGVHVGWTQRF
jgi:hypothetical protein